MNLYSTFANKFSEKRQISWKGWDNLLPLLKQNQPLNLLDLGCGNARLLKTIANNKLLTSSYVGVDNSEILLNIAKKDTSNLKIPNLKFVKANLEDSNWENNLESNKFNIICSFGLMHHIKSVELRNSILEKSIYLLKENGYLIFSFWQFKQFDNFLKKHLINDLGNDDFILSFGGKESGAQRFCHNFSDEELINIDKNLNGIKRVWEFSSDGIESKMNKYIIWQKTSTF